MRLQLYEDAIRAKAQRTKKNHKDSHESLIQEEPNDADADED